jgi:uncharacterized protein
LKREIEKELYLWRARENRMPLLIRGGRQVGKTYLVEAFGREAFSHCMTVNFEFQPELKRCFETLDPKEILNKLGLLLKQDIQPGETLLFLDEIQECPSALTALRYFKEKLPSLHVIGAGSLLEFTLKAQDFRMPVGRVQFLHLYPVSFAEFLNALGHTKLQELLSTVQEHDSIDEVIHQKLLDLVRQYFTLGGMPAVVDEYLKTQNLSTCHNIQSSIIQTYRGDFGKYAGRVRDEYLQRIFNAAPRMVGNRFKYVRVDPQIKSRELKKAFHLLVLAGLIHPIYASSASGLPLRAQINEKKIKINFMDVGLVQNVCGLQTEIAFKEDLMQINSGAVAEQFVGQELLAYGNPYDKNDLFFWTRERRNSSAEIDFVISVDSDIYPIEVKSGKSGTLKSLHLFLNEKKPPFGIKLSKQPLSFQERILSIPLYMVSQLPRLVRTFR